MIAIRWTMGDVSPRGFEALRLSVWGAWRIFGSKAQYAVCVNTISVALARAMTGEVPEAVRWVDVTDALPEAILRHMDGGRAEGVGWKLAPPRLFPDDYEISLDNDCILWELPQALGHWLSEGATEQCVMAEDVTRCFGQFAELCPERSLNAGIRGLPPGFDLERSLVRILEQRAQVGSLAVMTSELDEQGLQAAALSVHGPPRVVSLADVTICSPFWPHVPQLGRCGAHFVGLNARHIPWDYYGRPADEWMREHWELHVPILRQRVGLGTVGGSHHASTSGYPGQRGGGQRARCG